jgi:hypothetical protein
MRSYGWFADTMPELAMNLGMWVMIWAVGAIAGPYIAQWKVGYVLLAGVVVGCSGQIAWWIQRSKSGVSNDG